jgi:tetratricopeptide (TPR) repeat protein
MRFKFYILIFIFCVLAGVDPAFAQRRGGAAAAANQATGTITVLTEPKATIWVDGVLRGETDESGKLVVKPVLRGTRKLKVRADGFKEVEKNLLPSQRGNVKIALIKTSNQAELAFQEAENAAGTDRVKAIQGYEKAIKLQPGFSEAYLGLARVLSTAGDTSGALEAIRNARRYRRIYPEASAVEGRIYNSMGEYDLAIDAFDRAVKEGRGFQPEAHTGLGLLFKEEAESANADNDKDDEKYYYTLAATHLEKAIDQLSGTEPVVYLFLGKIYEEMDDKKKAIAVYERFLRDMPDDDERSAVESFIDQLKKPDPLPQNQI